MTREEATCSWRILHKGRRMNKQKKFYFQNGRAQSLKYRIAYHIEFEAAIGGHHIYKDVWQPTIGMKLLCQPDPREEAIQYDKNVFCSNEKGTLVGHIPIKLSSLMTYFLRAGHTNQLSATVIGKRTRELGLVVFAK